MSDPRSETPESADSPEETPEIEAPEIEPTEATGETSSEADVEAETDVDEAVDVAAATPEEIEAEASPAPIFAETAARPVRTRRQKTPPTPTPVPDPRITGPYAIVETGGKQYRVSVGDTLAVERLHVEAGSEITIDRVLLLGGDGTTRVGTPTVEGAAVTARVEDHGRGEKIVVFKYKAKKRYRRRMGHRQSLTRLAITGISG